MVHTIVGYPSRGQAPEIPAMRLNCDPKTISRGIAELESEEQMTSTRQRKKGVEEKP